MTPTKERNHSAVLLTYEGDGILIDCGEGTQRQLKIAGLKTTVVNKILISHWHGDHVLGLPGLVQTLGTSEYTKTLRIYGPKGTKEHFNYFAKAFDFDLRIAVEVHDITQPLFFQNNEYELHALPLDHAIPTLGFRFMEKDRRNIDLAKIKAIGMPEGPLLGKLQTNHPVLWRGKTIQPDDVSTIKKGKVIAYVVDTLPCKNAVALAKDADLLIAESSYLSNLEEKAEQYKHMTAKQAAQIAHEAGVKKLVLTHFSQRYKAIDEIREEASAIFPQVVCAEDFLQITKF